MRVALLLQSVRYNNVLEVAFDVIAAVAAAYAGFGASEIDNTAFACKPEIASQCSLVER